jgi:phage gpG-like protein
LNLEFDFIGSLGKGKRPKDFPKKFDDNFKLLLSKFLTVDADILFNKEQINVLSQNSSSNELQINNALNRITINEQDITSLNDSISDIQSQIDIQNTNISNIDQTIIDLNDDFDSKIIQVEQAINDIVSKGEIATVSLVNTISGDLRGYIYDNEARLDELVVIVNNIQEGVTSKIGLPTDGTFSDGVISNIDEDSLVADAFDEINEFLLTISPTSPSFHNSLLSRNNGEVGKLSFGVFNISIGYITSPSTNANETFNNSGNKAGIHDGNANITGVLAYGNNGASHDDNAFSDAEKGMLKLYVNNVEVGSVDLESTTNAIGYSSGSGFSVSEVKYTLFESGSPSTFTYRTGNYRVVPSDISKGSNVILVKHIIDTEERVSQSFEIIVDKETVNTTINQSFSNLNMGGIVELSGIKYHTNGTVNYQATISNAYRNTYSLDDITHPSNSRLKNLPTESIPNLTVNSNDDISLNQTISINTNNRILNQGISINTFVPRLLGRDFTSSTLSSYKLLVDPYTNSGGTDLVENFNTEKYRMYEGNGITTDTNYSSGSRKSSFTWDSSKNLAVISNNEYNGLLQYNGTLRSPKQGLYNGDFTNVANGAPNNANYSAMNGILTYLRYFYVNDTYANFNLSFTSSGTVYGSNALGNQVKVECMIPGSGTGYGVYYDCSKTQSNGGVFGSGYGGVIPTNWGVTMPIGVNTAITKAIVFKISASSEWTGNISNIVLNVISEG